MEAIDKIDQKYRPYKIVQKDGRAEIIEKKSKFIATVHAVETEEEAIAFLEEMKKQYWDASHNCFAYVIGKDANCMRCSDAGEPSQTAGRPMLEVLLGEEIRNVIVVVTRYFGGTLLGTGGLTRAYSQAAKEGLAASGIAWMRYGVEWEITIDYNYLSKIQYCFEKRKITIGESEYTQCVRMHICMSAEQEAELRKELVELTGNNVEIQEVRRAFYVDKQGVI